MNKITLSIVALLVTAIGAQASVTLSGTSIFSAEILGDSKGVYISSNNSVFDESLFSTLASGTSFTLGAVIGNYTVLGAGSVNTAGSDGALDTSGGLVFNLSGNIATGNEIGVLVFGTSTGSASASDTYTIWTNNWLVANDGANASLTGGGPFTGASFGSGTVVPEPATYAAIAGALVLGFTIVRRRRRA
jgi:hypothetical protein